MEHSSLLLIPTKLLFFRAQLQLHSITGSDHSALKMYAFSCGGREGGAGGGWMEVWGTGREGLSGEGICSQKPGGVEESDTFTFAFSLVIAGFSFPGAWSRALSELNHPNATCWVNGSRTAPDITYRPLTGQCHSRRAIKAERNKAQQRLVGFPPWTVRFSRDKVALRAAGSSVPEAVYLSL